jgi:uncharacterized protein YjiK
MVNRIHPASFTLGAYNRTCQFSVNQLHTKKGHYTSVFKSATSRPDAPGILTGVSDLTFRASRSTSWQLKFFSRLVVDMADKSVDLVPCAAQPAQDPLGIETLKPQSSSLQRRSNSSQLCFQVVRLITISRPNRSYSAYRYRRPD